MTISSKNYHETYLKEWAIFVMKGLFTTSPNEVERQIADMKVVSSNTESLNKFFQNHLQFVKGSNVSSVFFSKDDDSAKSIEARSDFLSNFLSILATMAAPQYGTSDLQQPMLQMALISVNDLSNSRNQILQEHRTNRSYMVSWQRISS